MASVNPNNPTGTMTPEGRYSLASEEHQPDGSVVIVDEAYFHFSTDDSVIDQAWRLTRTSSSFAHSRRSMVWQVSGPDLHLQRPDFVGEVSDHLAGYQPAQRRFDFAAFCRRRWRQPARSQSHSCGARSTPIIAKQHWNSWKRMATNTCLALRRTSSWSTSLARATTLCRAC